MTEKKYLRAIWRQLNCGISKKKEITRQVESDIRILKEEGKTLEEAIKEIGTSTEIAREFNENMGESDIAARKREERWKTAGVFLGMAVVLLLIAYWMSPRTYSFGRSGHFSEEDITERAKVIIGYLDKDDFAAMEPLMSRELRSEKMEKAIRDAKKQLADDFGEFRSWGNVSLVEATRAGEHMAVIEIKASYENVGVTYTLSFSEGMLLNGIYMR